MNLDGGVIEGGEGVDDGGIEATWKASGSSGKREKGISSVIVGLRALADVDGEEAHEEKCGDKYDDDDGDGGAETVVVRVGGACVGLSSREGDCRREEEEKKERQRHHE